jgi:Cu-Zn family superoxide dismutase
LVTLRIFAALSVSMAFCVLSLGAARVLAAAETAPVTAAIAVIHPTSGNVTAGVVTFTAVDGGVKVIADVTGLTPGKHGFHIHEFGDISDSAKAMSTGGHYDPDGTHHHALVDADRPVAMSHHAGDMGNLLADSAGKAHLEMTLPGVSLMGPANPIVGRAVIIHANSDDGGQPVGNAGGRVGQGVIGVAKAK